MTDNTQPEALRLAEQYDYGDPVAHSNMWKVAVCNELRRQHARIAELEAQLEAVGAGGVSGPLMGQPQAMPDLSALTERGAKAWAGVDAQALRGGTHQQAAPKAAPTRTALPEGWTDCTIEFGNDGPEVVAYGPKRMMIRLAKWLGKYFAQVIAEAAPKAAPVELHDHQILAITTAYEQGVGKGRQAHESGKEIANPYDTAYRCDLAWQYGYKEGKEQAERIAKAAPQQEAQEPTEIPEEIERMAADRYKVVPSHESMFHRWAVVAGTGTQQLYLGREVECQNMARKFAGAFLDGAFVAMQRTAHQPVPLSDDVSQKAWALLDELEKLRSVNREEEDWGTLNKRSDELRAALAAQGDTP